MTIIVNFHVFWLLLMRSKCSADPTEPLPTMAVDPKLVFINQPAKGYDTDFAPFMKKMFSGLPGVTSIKKQMKGPNAGYRPYWYAYNFALGWKAPQKDMSPYQSSHEDWDYGLGRGSGQGLWGGGELSIMHGVGNAVLGAGDLVDKDISADGDDAASKAPKKVCFPNLGPTCELGPPPTDYNDEYIEAMRKRTLACDTCSDKSIGVGLVCSVDKTGKVFQDLDLCVMDKMNCLGGIAYINSLEERVFSNYPFLMQPQWARVSIKGHRDAEIRMYDKHPYYSGKTSYRLVVYGWPYYLYGPLSALYRDFATDNDRYSWEKYHGDAINKYAYTEYTITWNPDNGWFLMSQARVQDWKSKFYVEYVDPKPRDMKYIDLSSGWYGRQVQFILHDLTMLYTGACKYVPADKDAFPSDTDAVRKRSRDAEAAYQLRYKILLAKGVSPKHWDAEDGSYIEY